MDSVDNEGLVQVTFIDYGNTDILKPESIVNSNEDIPKDQLADSLVWEHPISRRRWAVGMSCLARWSEDHIWYNAVITAVGAGECSVIFCDYGTRRW